MPRSGKGEFRSRPAWRAAQGSRRPASQGGIFFGYFLLAAQKKVTSRRAAPGEVGVCKLLGDSQGGWWHDAKLESSS